MALFRKGILSALADSISVSTQISATKEKQSLLLVTAETLQSIGQIVNDENYAHGVKASAELVEVIKEVNKML